MPDVSYQNVLNIILPSLPENWIKIVMFVSFTEDVCDLKYYLRDNRNQYADCFQFCTDQDNLLNILAQLHREITGIRDQLSANDRWTSMTLCIEADGSFNADYDYSEASVEAAYYDEWKRRYLN